MAYNVRVIEYPNGQVQIRHYLTPLSDGRQPYSDDFLRLFDVECPQKKVIKMVEPFDGAVVREVDNFDDDEQRKIDNALRNANRAKQKIYTYSRSNMWDWFVTWTFDPAKVDRYDYQLCYNKMRKWIGRQQQKYARDLRYLIIPEMHKDGAWHYHGLLADCGDINFRVSGLVDKSGNDIYNLGGFRSGWTTATRVRDSHKASAYLCKYVTKDMLGKLVGKHRYLRSNNLAEPDEYLFFCDNDADYQDFLQKYCDSVGKKIAHVSHTRAKDLYTQVEYIELI